MFIIIQVNIMIKYNKAKLIKKTKSTKLKRKSTKLKRKSTKLKRKSTKLKRKSTKLKRKSNYTKKITKSKKQKGGENIQELQSVTSIAFPKLGLVQLSEKPTGQGNMAYIYKIKLKRDENPIAIKVPKYSPEDENIQSKKKNIAIGDEITILKKLDQFIDSSTLSDGRTIIAMKWVDGESLKQMAEKGNIKEKNFNTLVSAIGEAINKLHKAGIEHNDIQSSNIMITKNKGPNKIIFGKYNVEIIDFGFSQINNNKNKPLKFGIKDKEDVIQTIKGAIIMSNNVNKKK
jgi:hypothetical protein